MSPRQQMRVESLAHAENGRGGNVLTSEQARGFPLFARPDHLNVRRQEQPRREGDVVERLEAPLVTQERLDYERTLERRVVDARVVIPDADRTRLDTSAATCSV